MGVPEFLSKVLATAGRPLDLQRMKTKDDGSRLRIAVDISLWAYRVSMGYGHMLGDENHLSNYGRAELLRKGISGPNEQISSIYISDCVNQLLLRLEELQLYADILVVFDGETPPAKLKEVKTRANKRSEALKGRDMPVEVTRDSEYSNSDRIRSFKQAGAGQYKNAIFDNLMLGCRGRQIPFLVAPYEADAQLAFLAHQGHVDLIITEDSDLMTYGLPVPVLYKFKDLKGIMLRYQDLATAQDIDLFDFTPAMMACLFAAAGGDYCRKLKGIGPKTACEIIRNAFFGTHGMAPLQALFTKLFAESWENLDVSEQEDYRNDFCKAVLMMQHAVVYDPIKGCTTTMGEEDAELLRYQDYSHLCLNPEARAKVVGHMIPSPLVTYIAEGWIQPRGMTPREVFQQLPPPIAAELEKYRKSLNKIQEEASDEEDEEPEGPETQMPASRATSEELQQSSKRKADEIPHTQPKEKRKIN